MGKDIIELNEQSFEGAIAHGNWIVDMWASWCGPCKIMAPHFEAAAKDMKGEVHFAKVNIDENYELAQRFEIMSIPTLLLFKNGKVIHSEVGALNKEQIKGVIDENF